MSHIDSYSHEIVGLFGPLPVYHPLEDIRGDADERWTGDFSCTTGQIVLGGGSGEHPGLVLKKPAAAVALFLLRCDGGPELSEAEEEFLAEYLYETGILEFSGWDSQVHAAFYRTCCEAVVHPFHEEGDLGFEEWLTLSLGEFVFYAMPDLASEVLNGIDDPYKDRLHVEFNCITLIPPGMPVYSNGGNAFDMARRNPPG